MGTIDEYRTLSNDWLVSANFHEFAFGIQRTYFYAALAIGSSIRGASAPTNPKIAGKLFASTEKRVIWRS
ncbi:MAG: hypothetical protein R2795_21050 [Saprospiraceae bacterium]